LVAVHRAALALALQAQADAVIEAPFDGVVEERHVAPGVYLQLGEPVLTLVRTNPLRFRAGVPEREAMLVELGQAVRIMIAGHAHSIQAEVTRISPSLDMSSRSLLVEVDVPNPGFRLRTGLFAEAEIVVDPEARTLAVPAPAVSEFAGVEKVWVVRGDEAQEQRIRSGRRDGQLIEILDGLAPGDRIAVDAKKGSAGPVVVVAEEGPNRGISE
jgi:RND family efflux transporter MFP subunit